MSQDTNALNNVWTPHSLQYLPEPDSTPYTHFFPPAFIFYVTVTIAKLLNLVKYLS